MLVLLVYPLDLFWIIQICSLGDRSVRSLDFGAEMENAHYLSRKSVGAIILPVTKPQWRAMCSGHTESGRAKI